MYRGKRILGVMIARGGSKGLPGKNLRRLGDRPLIAWTIAAAAGSRHLDRCILSSDDAEIIATARAWGADVPFVRPAHLARDNVPAVGPLLHAADAVTGYDVVVLLQPTTPLRTASDIDGCIEMCIDAGAPSCVSVTLARKNPHWMFHVDPATERMSPVMGHLESYLRQELPPAYVLNGAVYVNELSALRESQQIIGAQTRAYVMPSERSVDIDTELDFRVAEAMVERQLQAA